MHIATLIMIESNCRFVAWLSTCWECLQGSDSYCGASAYYDGVEERCVQCSDICYGATTTQYCKINCPGSRALCS